MRKTIVTLGLLVVVLFLWPEPEQTSARPAITNATSSRPFDAFGNIRSGDRAARLDNFAIQLEYETEGYGYVVVFAPESASKRIRDQIIDYLVNNRGLPRKRVKTHHAGYFDPIAEPWIQLWIVPKGAEPPKVEKRKVDLAGFKGMLAEYQEGDSIKLSPLTDEEEDPEDIGPPIGNVVYAAFDDVLKAQKNSIAHVVAFNGVEDVPLTWRRVAASTVERLEEFGFAASRFKIGYGGQSKETKVQLWILPPGEMPPMKDPASEPAAAKAIKIDAFDNGTLEHAKNERAVFDRLLLVLRENPDLRAYLVVRMQAGEEDPVNLPKLVDKWKNELTTKHKLRNDRIVVLFADAEEYHLPSVELWMVPPGQSIIIQDTQSSP